MPPAPDQPVADGSLRLVLAAEPGSVRAALGDIARAEPLARAAKADRETVELVLAEVLNNVVKHAYRGAGGEIALALHRLPVGLACLVVDRGAPMPQGKPPPGRLPVPPVSVPGDLPEGGFGWAMIRSLTVELQYRREGGENRLGFVIPFAG